MRNNLLKLIVSMMAVAIVAGGLGCAGNKSGEEGGSLIDEQLVMFAVKVQADQYAEATELVAEDEQMMLLGPNGDVKEEYKAGMRTLSVSALQRMNLTLDGDDRIVGMFDAVKLASKKTQVSEEQKNLDIKAIEARGKERRAEQARLDSLHKSKMDSLEAKENATKDSRTIADSEEAMKEKSAPDSHEAEEAMAESVMEDEAEEVANEDDGTTAAEVETEEDVLNEEMDEIANDEDDDL